MSENPTRSTVHLFHELKSMYPHYPDEVVTKCIQQNGNDRERCMQALRSIPSSVLGGRPNDHVSRRLEELHITHEDSGSNHQYISRSRDTGANIHTSESWPNDLANNVGLNHQGRHSPSTSVSPQELNLFIRPNANKSPRQIPNINCATSYGGTDSSGTASPQSTGSPSEGRRSVKVVHYPPLSPTTPPISMGGFSSMPNQQHVYKIKFGADSGGLCTVAPQSTSMQNVNQPISVVPPPQMQYSPEVISGPQSYSAGQVSNQYKHSSEAKFFINNTNNGQVSPDRPSTIRTNNYSQYSPDSRLGAPQLSTALAGQTSPILGYSHIPNSRPLTIRSSGPEGEETTVRYIPITPETPQGVFPGTHNPPRFGLSVLPPNQTRGQFPSAVQAHYPAVNPSTAPSHFVNTTSSAYITPTLPRFPPVSSVPSSHGGVGVTSHGGLPSHFIPGLGATQTSSEHGNIVLQETQESGRHNAPYPTMSPASSQSSLSSESSRSDALHRGRSGSLQDEMAYTQALLEHQQMRMERLRGDYMQQCTQLETLRSEVSQMEKNMLETSRARQNSFPGVEDVTKMRQANRKLQTDIQVMVNDIELYKNGQVPFSVIDPHGQQNFYKNIPTGQRMDRNSIHANHPHDPQPHSRTPPPPLPKRDPLNVVPPAPPSQLPSGSGDSEEGEQWNCSACTFLNHPALNKCECCEMPRVTTGRATEYMSAFFVT